MASSTWEPTNECIFKKLLPGQTQSVLDLLFCNIVAIAFLNQYLGDHVIKCWLIFWWITFKVLNCLLIKMVIFIVNNFKYFFAIVFVFSSGNFLLLSSIWKICVEISFNKRKAIEEEIYRLADQEKFSIEIMFLKVCMNLHFWLICINNQAQAFLRWRVSSTILKIWGDCKQGSGWNKQWRWI